MIGRGQETPQYFESKALVSAHLGFIANISAPGVGNAVAFDNPITNKGVVYDSSTGIVTIKKGTTLELRSSLQINTSATGLFAYMFYDRTNSVFIGTRGQAITLDFNVGNSDQPEAIAEVTADSSDIEVELRSVSETDVSSIDKDESFIKITQIQAARPAVSVPYEVNTDWKNIGGFVSGTGITINSAKGLYKKTNDGTWLIDAKLSVTGVSISDCDLAFSNLTFASGENQSINGWTDTNTTTDFAIVFAGTSNIRVRVDATSNNFFIELNNVELSTKPSDI